jgi:DNA repair protein RecN (Recombination protein N)
MFIQLTIKNLILVESAEITFEKGLNILTGETGAGKSAILSAIRLIAGDRADPGLIGKYGEIGIVEAKISSYTLPDDLEKPKPGDPLVIRREISKLGKNRCFANDQQISLQTLRQIVGHSVEIVDQSSSHLLSSLENQRKILDVYCETWPWIEKLESSFSEQQELKKQEMALVQMSETRNRDLKWLEEDLQFILDVNWKKEEEEQLLMEHHRLTHSQELIEKMDTLSSILAEMPLQKAAQTLERCANLDSNLLPYAASLKSLRLEFDEISRFIHSYMNRLEADPKRLEKVEDRIAQIEQIKRRFGKTFDEVEAKKQDLDQKIETLKHLDAQLDQIRDVLRKKTEENREIGMLIRKMRKEKEPLFTRAILNELQSLNLPNAQFIVHFQEAPLSSHGMDCITFLFSANVGHPPIPISECASGGELSRLLFSMKVILSDKENQTCLIFDEIDGNVGGQTASILGEKLHILSQEKQIICITHFVQVARLAQTHFAVKKIESLGKTQISKLTENEKQEEYDRMLGVVKNKVSL